MRRRVSQPSSLTSLLDVLFIVAFASLAQASARVEIAEEPEVAEPEAETEPEAEAEPEPKAEPGAEPKAPGVGAEVSDARLYARAIVELTEAAEDRPAVLVRISAAGTVVEVSEKDTGATPRPLDVPLLVAHPNPDVALTYRGWNNADTRVCRAVREALGVSSLEGMLVVLAPEVSLADLPVALVSGLRQEPNWCLRDERAFAVVVDPALIGEAEGARDGKSREAGDRAGDKEQQP